MFQFQLRKSQEETTADNIILKVDRRDYSFNIKVIQVLIQIPAKKKNNFIS